MSIVGYPGDLSLPAILRLAASRGYTYREEGGELFILRPDAVACIRVRPDADHPLPELRALFQDAWGN